VLVQLMAIEYVCVAAIRGAAAIRDWTSAKSAIQDAKRIVMRA